MNLEATASSFLLRNLLSDLFLLSEARRSLQNNYFFLTKYTIGLDPMFSKYSHEIIASRKRESFLRNVCSFLLFFVGIAAVMSNQAVAGFVVISDFSSSFIQTGGGGWTWDSNAKGLDILAPFDLSQAYLREGSMYADITGATTLRLRASWIPLSSPPSDGSFVVELEGDGGIPFATANFSFSEFAAPGSPFITVDKPLNWVSNPTTAIVRQWDFRASSFSEDGGDMYFQEMGASDIASVPEPSSLIIFGLGAAGVAWRVRRKRAA